MAEKEKIHLNKNENQPDADIIGVTKKTAT